MTVLILGLGNPDPEYEVTRHNLGFRCVRRLAEELGIRIRERTARSRVGRGRVGSQEVVLALPQTYMNLSGRAAVALRAKYPVPLDRLWVVHDDIDLPFGRLRIRQDGGSAGHHGIESLVAELGDSEFIRFRVGVGRPAADTVDHVLGGFSRAEVEALPEVVDRVAEALQLALTEGLDQAMTRFNRA